MDDFATKDFVGRSISDHTLSEREFSDDRFASKKYEKALVAVAVTLAGGVIFGIGNLVISHFIQGASSPASIDQAYDP